MSDQSKGRPPPPRDQRGRQDRRKPKGNKPVGYCSPPSEHQWPAGHCPNPNGRPRKREITVKKSSTPNEFERRLIEDAKKVIGEINGEPVDNIDRVWRTLKANVDRPEVAKIVLQQYESAMEADHA